MKEEEEIREDDDDRFRRMSLRSCRDCNGGIFWREKGEEDEARSVGEAEQSGGSLRNSQNLNDEQTVHFLTTRRFWTKFFQVYTTTF
ncbi:hypothetical protein TorRG33x02_212230 [Trema orientale]|uniref:Uncharacterized protein n=1 Tax=Trema orientale TaxID=63057 RepID=A0A2P5EBU1_TREOI|nr:hypothetical protein TorRG33x02_212230 [Trema orientale]